MPDPSLSQADLEEALKARVTDLTDERDGLIDALIRAEEDRDEALAASRQPVSGGLTAEEAGAVADAAANMVPHSEINWKAQDAGIEKLRRLAALSRVPADGEQPDG